MVKVQKIQFWKAIIKSLWEKVIRKSTCHYRKNWEYQFFDLVDEKERDEKSSCAKTLFKMQRRG